MVKIGYKVDSSNDWFAFNTKYFITFIIEIRSHELRSNNSVV